MKPVELHYWRIQRTERNKRPFLTGATEDGHARSSSPVVEVVSIDPPVLRTHSGSTYRLMETYKDIDPLLEVARLSEELKNPPYPPLPQWVELSGSTSLSAYCYDEQRRFWVRFVKGAEWRYLDVPPEKVKAFEAAPSKGAYFSREIKNKHRAELTRRGGQ